MTEAGEELLPCPFCGGKARIESQVSMYDFGDCRISCDDCMARSDIFTDEDGDRVAVAIEHWNLRILSPELKVLREREKALVEALIRAKIHGIESDMISTGEMVALRNWVDGGMRGDLPEISCPFTKKALAKLEKE